MHVCHRVGRGRVIIEVTSNIKCFVRKPNKWTPSFRVFCTDKFVIPTRSAENKCVCLSNLHTERWANGKLHREKLQKKSVRCGSNNLQIGAIVCYYGGKMAAVAATAQEMTDSVTRAAGTAGSSTAIVPIITLPGVFRRRMENLKHNSECENDEQRHNQTLPSFADAKMAASDSGVFLSMQDIDRDPPGSGTGSVIGMTRLLSSNGGSSSGARTKEPTPRLDRDRCTTLLAGSSSATGHGGGELQRKVVQEEDPAMDGHDNDVDNDDEEVGITIRLGKKKPELRLMKDRTCQSLPDVNSARPKALPKVVTACDSTDTDGFGEADDDDDVDDDELNQASAPVRPCDTGGTSTMAPIVEQPVGSSGEEENVSSTTATTVVVPPPNNPLVKPAHVPGTGPPMVDPNVLQVFAIDPKLINKYDGLEQTLYYIDENGSPKIREKYALQRQLAEEKRQRKQQKKLERAAKFGGSLDGEPPVQCSCFSFSRLSRKLKEMCKLPCWWSVGFSFKEERTARKIKA